MPKANAGFWQELTDTVLDEKVRLETLVSIHHEAATYWGAFDENGQQKPVMVRVWPNDAAVGSVFDRHREATFLEHPNLLPCLGAGIASTRGESLVYGVYARPEALLSSFVSERSLSPAETLTLCEDLIGGLRYLHSLGLVYCNLARETVAHVGDRWTLADYSQLRPEGPGYGGETRRLMGFIAGAPPEAFSGLVSPAWDSWSLAHLIQSVMRDPETERELRSATASGRIQKRVSDLPEPFAAIASACLVPDPGSRCNLSDIEHQLRSQTLAESHPQSPQVRDGEEHPFSRVLDTESEHGYGRHYDRLEAADRNSTGWMRFFNNRAIIAGVATLLFLVLLTTLGRRGQPETSAATTSSTRTGRQEPSTSVPNDQAETRSRAEPAATGLTDDEQRIREVLQRWVKTFRDRDTDAHLRLYAPRLERYFRMSNVGIDYVRESKAASFRDIGAIREYEISAVDTQFTGPDKATVTFDKSWAFVGKRQNWGKVRGELKLQKQSGTWRITSERDLKVYRQSRPGA